MASSIAVLEEAVHAPQNEAASLPSHEREVAMLVRELFIRAREARRVLMEQWKRNYRVLNNRDYMPGGSPWDEEPAVNDIWPVVASAVAWMTDQRPTIEVTASTEQFSEYWDFYNQLAEDMNTVLNAVFQNYLLDAEINKALWDVYTYGVGYFKTTWEPWLADGLGDVAFRRRDPFTIYPDPFAHNESELTYIIEAHTMTVADADRTWPGAAAKLTAQYLEDHDEAPHRLDTSVHRNQPRVAMGRITGTGVNVTAGQYWQSVDNPSSPHESPVVTVLEAYVRAHKVHDTDENGVKKVTDEWRCIVVCGTAVLMDKPCDEVNAYGTHPYTRLVLFDPGEWYGPCVVELLTPLQRMINWLLGAINRNVYLMGNPVLVEGPSAASRNRRYTNRPGQRLVGNPQEITWLNPPQMHPQIAVELIQFYKGEIETISGLSAMVRGFAPTGRNSEGVLDSVQDAAFVRVRASLRELERSLRGVALKMCANIAEFYTEPRLMSIIGPGGQRTHLALRSRHFYAIDADNPDDRVPLRFSLLADAGSQLPTSKQARAAEAKTLFKLGVIDEYETLKAMGWPNFQLVAQRVMERKAQLAMAEGNN